MVELFIAGLIEVGILGVLKRLPYPRLWVQAIDHAAWQTPPALPETTGKAEFPVRLAQKLLEPAPQGAPQEKARELAARVREAWPFHIFETEDYSTSASYLDIHEFDRRAAATPALKINCGTYVHLFCAACAALGIPARVVIAADPAQKRGHILCEIFALEKGWMALDVLYDCMFRDGGKFLSAPELREASENQRAVQIERGRARLDDYCKPERLQEFLRQGLLRRILHLNAEAGARARFLRRGYLLPGKAEGAWWKAQGVLQRAAILVPILGVILGFSGGVRHG